MPSAADRFTRLEKVAIFLIMLGEERTREILSDVDLNTVEQLNRAMLNLGDISAEEKAAVMLEFAHFFYQDKPIATGTAAPPVAPTQTGPPSPTQQSQESSSPVEHNLSSSKKSADELAILRTLEKLRQHLDPSKIDWGKAGYDFGEGFKGPGGPR